MVTDPACRWDIVKDIPTSPTPPPPPRELKAAHHSQICHSMQDAGSPSVPGRSLTLPLPRNLYEFTIPTHICSQPHRQKQLGITIWIGLFVCFTGWLLVGFGFWVCLFVCFSSLLEKIYLSFNYLMAWNYFETDKIAMTKKQRMGSDECLCSPPLCFQSAVDSSPWTGAANS